MLIGDLNAPTGLTAKPRIQMVDQVREGVVSAVGTSTACRCGELWLLIKQSTADIVPGHQSAAAQTDTHNLWHIDLFQPEPADV